MKCAVLNCKNYSEKCNLRFYCMPKDAKQFREWVKFCGRDENFKFKNARICSAHFHSDDFERNIKFEMGFSKKSGLSLKPGSIPTIPSNTVVENVSSQDMLDNIASTSGVMVSQSAEENDIDQLKAKIQALEATVTRLRTDNFLLKEREATKNKEVSRLQKELEKYKAENEFMTNKLSILFTPGQIELLKSNKKKKSKWSYADIAQSITLYSAGARAYRLLRRKEFPLPGIRTLQHYAQQIEITPGVIGPVFNLLAATTHLTDTQRLCVLSYDEMKIKKKYVYSKSLDATFPCANYVQVGMLRGLVGKWKQPIYFDFDKNMTGEILFEIMRKVRECNFNIVAVVSDLGGGNRGLFTELGVTCETPWFLYEEQKVFAFADPPHMLKLLRNHFLDSPLTINGKKISKKIVEKMLSVTNSTISITHKITSHHLTISGSERQNVACAAKLFSHTMAVATTRIASTGALDGENWEELSQLFKITNDWFDVLNVRVPKEDSRERRHAFGLALDTQLETLDKMDKLIADLRVGDRKILLPFQLGILQTNSALRMLYQELKEKYGLKYILTYRLNQDVIENFFGIVRAKGGLYDHPDREEFRYRLRNYLLGRNEGMISDRANIKLDDTPDLDSMQQSLEATTSTSLVTCDLESINGSLTGKILQSLPNRQEDDVPSATEEECLELESLEHLAGYICFRLREKEPHLADLTRPSRWVDQVSEGGLMNPSQATVQVVEALEDIFTSLNGNGLMCTENYLKKHFEASQHVACSEEVKKIFFRSRMYFCIRKLNNDMRDASKAKRRKMNKTVQ